MRAANRSLISLQLIAQAPPFEHQFGRFVLQASRVY